MSSKSDYRSQFEEIERSVRVNGDDLVNGEEGYEHSICGCKNRCMFDILQTE